MSQHNRRGIVTMTGAMVFFVVNDALVKWVSADLSTPQLIFVRGVMTTALLLALAGWMGQLQHWRTTSWKPNAQRHRVSRILQQGHRVERRGGLH